MSYYMFMFYLILLGIIAFILLAFIYKNDDLEKEIDELVNLNESINEDLFNKEAKIIEREKFIEKQGKECKTLKDKLTVLEAYITSNNYGNAEKRLQKLKELVRDYQSQN